MTIKLTFLGGVDCVTGSCYLVETDNYKLLVDCGLYQERDCASRNWATFPVPPGSINAVLLTHAHLDHCGLIPKLVKQGLSCPIYCTEATKELAEIILLDSAHIQEEDAAFKKKRHEREGRKGAYPEIPLYTVDDSKASFPLFTAVKYQGIVQLGDSLWGTFYDAGHVLGSASVRIVVKQQDSNRTIVFSGDLGWWNKAILNDPMQFPEADYVVIESTYGDTKHESIEEAADQLKDTVNSTAKAGGNIVIPSFALERTQDILYYLSKLLKAKLIPPLAVFVDSPMAVRMTDIYERHPEILDAETQSLLLGDNSPFSFQGLKLIRTIDESKAISYVNGSSIIIAGSGMCTGGRIKHHLVANISRPESTILFVGYQARGTLGRLITEGAKEVRILGQTYSVKAKIVQINGFSAHGDRDSLFKWLSGFQKPPKTLFVTHGEADKARSFAKFVEERNRWKTVVPKYRDEIILD
jgi:metallo-beta-lactamase family protein